MTSSVSPDQSASSLLPSRPLLWTCRLLCSLALCISGYLAWTAFQASEVYGCGGGSVFDCGHVLTSKYAKVFGLSVSVPAFGLYASLLAVLAFIRPSVPEQLLKTGWSILTVGALAAGMAALWFIGIQVFVVEHLCSYCLAAHTCGLLLAGIVLWKHPLGAKQTGLLSSISLAGIGALMTAQILAKPPQTFTVERFDDSSDPAEVVDGAEFDAPIDFAPPGAVASADDDGLFAPPAIEETSVFEPPAVIEPPVVTDNEFVPPTGAIPTKSPNAVAGEGNSTDSTTDSTGKKTATDKPDVTANEANDDQKPSAEEDPGATAATAALLFISPSTASALAQLLPFDDKKPAGTGADENAKQTEAETTRVQKPVIPTTRLVSVSGNKFRLNSRQWPILGNPDAKYIFVEMFDYTCPHCRNTHRAIDGAFEKLGDDLAVIALPVPLDGSCNSTVRNTGPAHREACELARISVAVWRVDREKFKTFHDWMFEGHRSAAQARQKAAELVGQKQLAAELALPHAQSYVAKHVELYKRVGQGTVPKLMFPQSTITGEVSSPTTLVKAIRRELGQ
ncbi:VKOR family protein [Fuerstiella marisgermanici]|uniref:VKOR family protein n=1 Tax=Fuerstiella marisgermanici TaxID=1891926 RepID=A0A1P8WEK2_9PLAN|nr:VKOR family protein [Fuerstiella marisgermanici]